MRSLLRISPKTHSRRNEMSGENRGSTRRETVNAAVLSCRGRVITNDRRVPDQLVPDHFGLELGFSPCGIVERSFSPANFSLDRSEGGYRETAAVPRRSLFNRFEEHQTSNVRGLRWRWEQTCPIYSQWPVATTGYALSCCNLKYHGINKLHYFKQTFGIIAKVPKAIKFDTSRR